MKTKHFAKKDENKERYVKALLILHGIRQDELAEKIGVSGPLMSQVINGRRKGVKRKGRLIRQGVADALGMKVEDIFPKRAA